MGNRTSEDEQSYYVCGQCDTKIFHLKSEGPVIPCPECGWYHKGLDKNRVPTTIKLDLTQY